MRIELSVSSFRKIVNCQRLYYIEKVLGWEERAIKPWLVFGSSFGELMAYADTLGVLGSLDKLESLFPDPFKRAEAEYLLLTWDLKYNHQPEPVLDIDGQPGNEFKIELDLSHLVNDRFELIFIGYIDKVFSKHGEPMINERKTTSDPINYPSAYWKRLDFDPQIVGYSYGLGHTIGTDVDRGTYEVFRKPNKKIDSKLFAKIDDPVEYRDKLIRAVGKILTRKATMVTRRPYIVTEELRNAFERDFITVAEQIYTKRTLLEAGDRPELDWVRNPSYCEEFMGCVYKPFCSCHKELNDIDLIKPKMLRNR